MAKHMHMVAWAAGGVACLYGVIFIGMTIAFGAGHETWRIAIAVAVGIIFLLIGVALLALGTIIDNTRARPVDERNR